MPYCSATSAAGWYRGMPLDRAALLLLGSGEAEMEAFRLGAIVADVAEDIAWGGPARRYEVWLWKKECDWLRNRRRIPEEADIMRAENRIATPLGSAAEVTQMKRGGLEVSKGDQLRYKGSTRDTCKPGDDVSQDLTKIARDRPPPRQSIPKEGMVQPPSVKGVVPLSLACIPFATAACRPDMGRYTNIQPSGWLTAGT